MAQHLHCLPQFDNVEWFEFISKYQILKKRVEQKNNKGNMDLVSALRTGKMN